MTDREWTTSEIVDDPRIDHDDPAVRAAAERLHANESVDKHHRIGDRVCVYCALRASTALRALEAAGYAIYQRSGWEVTCPQCEEAGEVVPHDDATDCDLCVRGEFEGHTMDCPTCLGRGVVGVVPVGGEG